MDRSLITFSCSSKARSHEFRSLAWTALLSLFHVLQKWEVTNFRRLNTENIWQLRLGYTLHPLVGYTSRKKSPICCFFFWKWYSMNSTNKDGMIFAVSSCGNDLQWIQKESYYQMWVRLRLAQVQRTVHVWHRRILTKISAWADHDIKSPKMEYLEWRNFVWERS